MFVDMKALAGAMAFAALTIGAPASAATLIQYDFAGNTGTEASQAASFVADNLTAQNVTRGAGLGTNAGGNSLNSRGWSTNASLDYVGFGFDIADGYTATINQIVFGAQASNTGPGYMLLQASTDAGLSFSTLGGFNTGAAATYTFDLDLTATTSLLFRLVAGSNSAVNGDSIGTGGTFRIQNAGSPSSSDNPFTISGNVSQTAPIPEPATWAMMVGGFGLLGATMRRRKAVIAFA